MEVDLYLHVTYDVKATSSRGVNVYHFQESKSLIGKYHFFKSKYYILRKKYYFCKKKGIVVFERESIILLKKNTLLCKNESIIFVECIILSGRKYYFFK